MERAPCHGTHLVEKLKSDIGLLCVDYAGLGQEAKERIDLLG